MHKIFIFKLLIIGVSKTNPVDGGGGEAPTLDDVH